MAKEYARLFETDAEDIQTANAQFETGTSIRLTISYAVGVTLLIVAGFGIYNILNMMIYEKMDSIAILKATGFSGADVKRIFPYDFTEYRFLRRIVRTDLRIFNFEWHRSYSIYYCCPANR